MVMLAAPVLSMIWLPASTDKFWPIVTVLLSPTDSIIIAPTDKEANGGAADL